LKKKTTPGVNTAQKGSMMKNHSRAIDKDLSEEKFTSVKSAARVRSPEIKRSGSKARRKRAELLRIFPRKELKTLLANVNLLVG
jgi:hypothetical protein